MPTFGGGNAGLIQVVGVEGDNCHLIGTRVALNPSLRKEVSILRGMFSSNRKVRGRTIILLSPHHDIFQRIGITLHILNLFRVELFDCLHLFRCQVIFMADLRN